MTKDEIIYFKKSFLKRGFELETLFYNRERTLCKVICGRCKKIILLTIANNLSHKILFCLRCHNVGSKKNKKVKV